MATNVIFTRGNTATINATAITDGQILYNTTAGTQYLDNGTTRIQVGQNITVDAILNSSSSNPIANRGVAGVMMSSLSEISTVTQAGSLPDALAVKALNSNLTAINSNIEILGVPTLLASIISIGNYTINNLSNYKEIILVARSLNDDSASGYSYPYIYISNITKNLIASVNDSKYGVITVTNDTVINCTTLNAVYLYLYGIK